MQLRERIFEKFHGIGTGTLRIRPELACEFATGIANANAAIHVISNLCTSANALQSATLYVMFSKWLALLSEYELPKNILLEKRGEAASITEISQASRLMCHSRVFEVCVSQRGLSESAALEVAVHVTNAASAFFAFEQACRAPEVHTQRKLCAILRAVLGQPLDHAKAAAEAYLEEK